jgi:hypothetical protein
MTRPDAARRRWVIAAPFFDRPDASWLHEFEPDRIDAETVARNMPEDNWHDRGGTASTGNWRGHLQQGNAAWRRALTLDAEGTPAGVMTLFPQLPVIVGLRRRLSRQGGRIPLIAWTFNLGELPAGPKRVLAKAGLREVDRFIVHSTFEVGPYADALGLPRERFVYMPLQRRELPVTEAENEAEPFVLAMGTAKRDYATLFAAVAPLGLRTVVVAGPSAVAGLDVPACVEVRSGLSMNECIALSQQARINVVPVDNERTASGQVTVITAMLCERPVVATRCPGTVDYLDDGETGVLVPPRDAGAMRAVLQELWQDPSRRRHLGTAGRQHALTHFSDAAIARRMADLLDEVSREAAA